MSLRFIADELKNIFGRNGVSSVYFKITGNFAFIIEHATLSLKIYNESLVY